ncbi:MAG: heparinase II/III family protein, partial [Hyphomicrobiales bacterium]|nr:heparinase II/III family protein [Hyphomicrobiales bacterium]
EDILIGKARQRFTIRFHLHPDVHVSLTEGGRTALLRLGDGTGWRFRADTDAIVLEDSVYFGSGTARRSNVLVISGATEGQDETAIRWAFRREKRPPTPTA